MTEFDRLARFYDLEHADCREDLAMYAGFARAAGAGQRAGAGVLELACGSGRCLLPLAAAGHDVTGLDVSPAMLALARANAEGQRLHGGASGRVRLVEGDMRDFALERTFGLIFIALNSLMHLDTQADQLRAIRCAGRHLAPGGRLLIDLFNPDVALPDAAREGQLFLHCLKVLPGGVHRLHFQSPTVDRAAQRVTLANYYDEIAPDGTVKRYLAPFTLRYLWRGELELLVGAAGLQLEGLYGSYDLDPFEGDSPRLIAVGRRPE
jgi:SAM-dependent methyltransferase